MKPKRRSKQSCKEREHGRPDPNGLIDYAQNSTTTLRSAPGQTNVMRCLRAKMAFCKLKAHYGAQRYAGHAP